MNIFPLFSTAHIVKNEVGIQPNFIARNTRTSGMELTWAVEMGLARISFHRVTFGTYLLASGNGFFGVVLDGGCWYI